MTKKLFLYESKTFDPHYNLSVEQQLLETVEPGECILYLWQNQNTVVIGRNQNAWKECRVTRLEEDGGILARRLSGGGAVFHDLGNLNFTFLVPTPDYNLSKQMHVILTACRNLGIPAELSGRNDLLADGRKFSGNAFYHNRERSYHHGTLLVNIDMAKMGRYLNPSPAKLEAKGVDSVRSRVINLETIQPDITISKLKDALFQAFCQVYDMSAETVPSVRLDENAIDAFYQHNKSWSWCFGPRLPFDFSCQGNFPWGELRVELTVENGIIHRCAAWTDAMEWSLSRLLEESLTGCQFILPDMLQRIIASGVPYETDIIDLLKAQNI